MTQNNIYETFNSLSALCGNHSMAAKELGYSVRHYRLLRQQAKNGIPVCSKARKNALNTLARVKRNQYSKLIARSAQKSS